MANLNKTTPSVLLCQIASFLDGKDVARLCRAAKGINGQLESYKKSGGCVKLSLVFDAIISSAFGHEAVLMHPVKLTLLFRDFSVNQERWTSSDRTAEIRFVRGVALGIEEKDNSLLECDTKSIVHEFPDLLSDNDEDVQIDLNTILIRNNIKKLTGFSEDFGNSDTRGGGCGDFKQFASVDDFTYTIENPEGITVKDLIEVAYRLKGSKYDFWYELFGGTIIRDLIKLENDNYELRVEFGFGYGS